MNLFDTIHKISKFGTNKCTTSISSIDMNPHVFFFTCTYVLITIKYIYLCLHIELSSTRSSKEQAAVVPNDAHNYTNMHIHYKILINNPIYLHKME